MYAFTFPVLIKNINGSGSWNITSTPNADVCAQVPRTIESHGGGEFGGVGECIEVRTNKPLNNVVDTLNSGGQRVLTVLKENRMKSMYLKSALVFISVGIMVMPKS